MDLLELFLSKDIATQLLPDGMSRSPRPLILVHGLWDNPNVFSDLVRKLEGYDMPLMTPHLPHRLGRVPLKRLAQNLNVQIIERWGIETCVDILGFSMGGLISRIWLQQLGGSRRTHRFISVGCPHRGTYTAQLVPSWLLPGVADMKRGSPLISELDNDLLSIGDVTCSSFFSYWDLMVIPGWEAVLPMGEQRPLSVRSHRNLISHPVALDTLVNVILQR